VNKYIELWMKNAFDEWKLFCGFDTMKFIANLFEDQGLNKIFVDMLSSFVLQITKKMPACILQPRTVPYHFLNVFIIRFLFIMCFFLSVLFMLLQVMCFFLLLGLGFMCMCFFLLLGLGFMCRF
jgi:hypothetical protein